MACHESDCVVNSFNSSDLLHFLHKVKMQPSFFTVPEL